MLRAVSACSAEGVACAPPNLESRARLLCALQNARFNRSKLLSNAGPAPPSRSLACRPRTADRTILTRRSALAISVLFTAGNLLSITGRLMLAVAVEWEIYARTHSATALGLVGLAIAVPVVTLSLPAGHLADRFSRKRIILVSQVFSALTSLALALVSWKHLSIPQIAPLREGNRALAAVAGDFRAPSSDVPFR